MSFRRRIIFASAAAVAVAVLLASALVYVLTSNELHGQVDSQLHSRSDNLRLIEHHPTHHRGDRLLDALAGRGGVSAQQLFESGPQQPGEALSNVAPRPNQVRGYQQLVDASGKVLFRSGAKNVTLPVEARTRALAAGKGEAFFRDATVNGLPLRILAEHLAPGRVVQFAQPLSEVDELLSHLRLILVLLSLGGILLAALLGQLVARAAMQPVRRLTRAAEHVAETQDLSGRIAPTGDDEVGRLAVSFNAMLDALEVSMAALDASVHAQRQLVADASHELRTPVTSLRTNIEILQHAPGIDGAERERLLDDVVEQIGELTLLMNDLIDLARGEQQHTDVEDVRLDAIVAEALARAQRNSPATPLRADLDPVILSGVAGAPGPRDRQPDRQRDQVQPPRRARRDRPAWRRADRPRPRSRHLRRGPAARLRPLLPRRRGARAPRLGAGPGDRQAGHRPARRNGHRRAPSRRRHVDARHAAGGRAAGSGRCPQPPAATAGTGTIPRVHA